jgi:hypothetical protein
MADMLTFDGVPVATYGLTGLMLVFLTGMTFIDTNSTADTSMAAVATASVPAFMGNMLTPSAPSFVDTLTQSASDLIQPQEQSIMSKLTGSSEEPSIMDKLTGPSEEPSLMSKLTAPLTDKSSEGESDFLKRGGGKKKNKGKKTRKYNNKRTN